MTYWLNINQNKAIEWGLTPNEAITMCVFADLESWADKLRSRDKDDDDFYYVLYLNKIVKQTPLLGSRQTAGRAVARLEELGIIKSINKHSRPAYALTEKGLSWKKMSYSDEKPNDGETAPAPKLPKEPKPPKKQNKYVLAHKERFEFLNKEYVADLFASCIKMATDKNIPNPKERFEEFAEHHSKHGNKFSNWRMAFGTWLRKYEKFNKPKGGEFAPEGLYQ